MKRIVFLILAIVGICYAAWGACVPSQGTSPVNIGRLSTGNEVSFTNATSMTSSSFGVPHSFYSATNASYDVYLPSLVGNDNLSLSFSVPNYSVGVFCLLPAVADTLATIDFLPKRCLWAGESVTIRNNGGTGASSDSWWTKIAGSNKPVVMSMVRSTFQNLSTANYTTIHYTEALSSHAGADALSTNRGYDTTSKTFKAPRDSRYRFTASARFNCYSARSLQMHIDYPVDNMMTAHFRYGANTNGGVILPGRVDGEVQIQVTSTLTLVKDWFVRAIAYISSGTCTIESTANYGVTPTLNVEEIPSW